VKGTRATINGLPVTVVSEEEAETCDVLICMRKTDDPGTFKDNVEDSCSKCSHAVVMRPYAPKKPKRICMVCALGGALVSH
jgi:hypothetical protein